jgi:hypothetical protein
MNNDKAITATSLRMPDGLLRLVTKAAHKCELSRTAYITQALQSAVAHDLPDFEYKQAWDSLQNLYDNLEPDIDNKGNPDQHMMLVAVLDIVLPQLKGKRS